jgi:hypothetical protein
MCKEGFKPLSRPRALLGGIHLPYVQISTSAALSGQEKSELRTCALSAMEMLGKKRQYVMVHILDGQALTRGEAEGDCAFCDVRVMGAADKCACDGFSARLSADIARVAHTAPQCVYLTLSELSMCYTDGKLPPGHAAV